jgi:SpoIID/LytB domain protein
VQALPTASTTGQPIDHWRLTKKSATIELQAHWSGAWHLQTADVGSPVTVSDSSALIAVVEPNGSATKTIRYRGQLVAELESGSMEAVDDVLVESYVDAVVPSEMTFSWPAAALQSQAVAARTYAWRAISDPKASWYDLDGDTRDQAYGGFGSEHKASNAAVQASAGEVAVDATGAPIFAQYSAADGGWTSSGGEPYLPAKRDPYDGAVPNDAHAWSVTLTATAIAAAYPSIGTLTQLLITGRDGNGTWGGRVTSMSVVGSDGSTTVTGADFQAALGLRSDWFRPAPAPRAPAGLTATVAGHTVTLQWKAPAAVAGAASLTGYKVTLSPGSHTTTVAASITTASFANLAPGSYTAKVVAKSAAGSGAAATVPVTVKVL